MIDVLIIGAGPTGLTAAAEAVRHGLSVRIVDDRKSRSIHSKALVLHSRSLEVFADMGFIDQVLQNGQEFRALNIYAEGKPLTRIDFHTIDWQDAIYPFWLSIPQSETERCLEEHLARLGVQVERQTKLTELTQQDDRVQVTLSRIDDAGEIVSEEVAEASWLIGCDGARSSTRKLSHIPYEGTTADELFILGDVQIEWEQSEDEGYNFMSNDGILLVVPLPQPKQVRVIAHMPALSVGEEPEITLELLQSLMDQRTGMNARLYDLQWRSSFSVKHMVAANHRQGRVFLAGDAAHIHSPVGGQGLNTGIQDAYNLIWKLALVHQGKGTEKLFDSYEAERHQVAAETIKQVRLATKIVTLKNPISRILRNQLAAILINTDAVQNRFGRDVGMLDINYRNSPIVSEEVVRRQPIQQMRQMLGNGDAQFGKGPSSGDRAPNVLFSDEKGAPHSLVDYLYGTEHTLLLFSDLNDPHPSQTLQQVQERVAQQYAGIIRCYLVTTAVSPKPTWNGDLIFDKDGAIHRRYGAGEEALYLIRPDHHIGYRSQPVKPTLFMTYLENILIPN
jgi:2-polyprenyl-6-methoxyphenol hydroxylase-like FAD-dependent oxidoreductase